MDNVPSTTCIERGPPRPLSEDSGTLPAGCQGDADTAESTMAGDSKMPSPSTGAGAFSGKHKKRKSKKKKNEKPPQQKLNEYWQYSQARKPSKITSIFPRRLYRQLLPASDVLGLGDAYDRRHSTFDTPASSSSSSPSSAPVTPTGSHASTAWSTISTGAANSAAAEPGVAPPMLHPSATPAPPHAALGASTVNAATSYETAAQQCRAAVARVVRECRRTNEKYTDQDFNLENDPRRNCLRGLVRRRPAEGGEDDNTGLMPLHTPQAVHRVDWIFQKPVFTVEGGFAASDVRQGRVGDCWWIAAVATIAHRTDLMQRVCVARDETCGVYGFVFQRDGAWVWVVVDDNLYLHHYDFFAEKYDSTGQRAREHRDRFQRGSKALSFARCEDENETWLPLLEKAFAKAHGDYGALAAGWCGEGVEDLTGGVSTTVMANRVLDKDRLWAELENADGHFVFGVSILGCTCHNGNHNGLAVNHCYSVLRAVEVEGEDGEKVRLVKIRNPWGERNEWTGFGEWHGPWSDGSKEWNAYWFDKLNHKFGDNGVFWMSFGDMLDTFGWLHRTRLFDAQWTVVQQWASVDVAWVAMGYLQTRFAINVKRPGTVVIVLSQLDDRYFRGLKGQYKYSLHFVLRSIAEDGTPSEVLSIVHASNVHESRSISCEVEISVAGRYEVVPQVKAQRNRRKVTIDEVVRENAEANPDKLRQIGRQYDEAHAKGADVADEDLTLEAKRARKVDRLRAKKAWAKEQKRRAREKKYRDEVAEWKKRRDNEKKEKKDKEKKKDKKEHGEEEKNEEQAKASELEEENKDSVKPDSGGSDADADSVVDDTDAESFVDLGPDPRPVPEPDFDSETDSDADDEDLLLLRGDSDSDDDGDDDGHDSELAKIRKNIERKGWPYDNKNDGHGHGHCHSQPNINPKEDKWNAVCVLGLRVYSQDPETTIDLVKPEEKRNTTDSTMEKENDAQVAEEKREG